MSKQAGRARAVPQPSSRDSARKRFPENRTRGGARKSHAPTGAGTRCRRRAPEAPRSMEARSHEPQPPPQPPPPQPLEHDEDEHDDPPAQLLVEPLPTRLPRLAVAPRAINAMTRPTTRMP